MGTTPKWERGSHLEISTDEKLDYLYTRDDAQQEQIDELIEGGGGGGSGVFEIYFEVYWDEDANADVVTCNKTLEEIIAAKTAGQYLTARAMIWQNAPSKFPAGFDVDPEYNQYEFVFDWIDNDPSFNYMYSGRIQFDISTQKWKWTYSQYTVTPYVPSP